MHLGRGWDAWEECSVLTPWWPAWPLVPRQAAAAALSSARAPAVHPTAVVASSAKLGAGVQVGAFCVVGAGATLGDGVRLLPGAHVCSGGVSIGEGTVIHNHAVVGDETAPGRVVLGARNVVGTHAVVGARCQDLKYEPGSECHLEVGDENDIREFASIHRSSRPEWVTTIGNRNLIMGSAHVAHDCVLGDANILANATLLAGHVRVGDCVHFGGAAAVHQFCQVGDYSFVAGGAMVERDVPAFLMVQGDRALLRGLNQVGLRRSGFDETQLRALRHAYMHLFVSDGAGEAHLEERMAQLEAEEGFEAGGPVAQLLASIRGSERGICKFRFWAEPRA